MQFHLNGFSANPPGSEAREAGWRTPDRLPEEVDVLIVGAGPTGLTLAAQLAAFPGIRTCIVEQKEGPLRLGQADGIACRTMEMFQAFGFAEKVLKESYWVNETAFWKPGETGGIVRSGRIQDTEDGLSEFPHVILNQARVHDFYLERMAAAGLVPDYGRRLVGLERSEAGPVTVTLERTETGEVETVRAAYVVGCDGARSGVRRALGLRLEGDSANVAWGVMDVLAVTDFPDIRLKAAIQSAGEGNAVLIPREGGYLFRLYVEMDTLAADERVASRNMTVDHVIAAAQRIFRPYTLDVKEVAWWSVYEIGQRLAERFDDAAEGQAPRVFIAGDACHTHSPKAGQGMNVSMQDGFNLGWKLAAVLSGRSDASLLRTYSAERQVVARRLIDFDREFAAMFSARAKAASGGEAVDPAAFQRYFQQHGRFTAGTAIRYAPGLLTGAGEHQALATGFEIGTRFHSAPVIRLADAKPVQLGHTVEADGRWRLFAFAGAEDPADPGSAIARLCRWLAEVPASPVRRFTPRGEDIDAVIDVRAVLQQAHRDLDLGTMPPFLLPRKGRLGLVDYEKIFCPDLKDGPDIFEARGIDRAQGAIVLVRPDQFVAEVLPLGAREALGAFLERFMIPAEAEAEAAA